MSIGKRISHQENELHALRCNNEFHKQKHWDNVADYFKTWDVKTFKYTSWSSAKYFQQSEEARAKAEKKEKIQATLCQRRERLKHLLDMERKMYDDELKHFNSTKGMPVDELKTVNYELKRRSEESRRREAELIEYQRWKNQQPLLKDFQRRQNLEYMKQSWVDQIKERETAMEKIKLEEYLREQEDERKRKEEEDFEKCCQRLKDEEVKYYKCQLKKQMEEMKESLQKYKQLEKQEEEGHKNKKTIDEIIIQRQLTERKQTEKQLVDYWTQQYQLKLQKKAKEMEDEIILDQKILERLNNEINIEVQFKAKMKEIVKQQMEIALQELQTHRQRELLRQKEYEHMLFDEAKRVWNIQRQKWDKEKQARDTLMKDVLDTLKKQVEENMRRKSAEKTQVLEEREEQLKDLNELYEQCNQKKIDLKLIQEKYQEELNKQVNEKMTEKAKKVIEESNFEQQQAEAELRENNKLASEIKKIQLNSNNYRPQDFRRQRVLW